MIPRAMGVAGAVVEDSKAEPVRKAVMVDLPRAPKLELKLR